MQAQKRDTAADLKQTKVALPTHSAACCLKQVPKRPPVGTTADHKFTAAPQDSQPADFNFVSIAG